MIKAHTFRTHHTFVILHLAMESICSQHDESLGIIILDQDIQPCMYLHNKQERHLTFAHTLRSHIPL